MTCALSLYVQQLAVRESLPSSFLLGKQQNSQLTMATLELDNNNVCL